MSTPQPQPRRTSDGIVGYYCDCCGQGVVKDELTICEVCERWYCGACGSDKDFNHCRDCEEPE